MNARGAPLSEFDLHNVAAVKGALFAGVAVPN
jgi:hypothetical protein